MPHFLTLPLKQHLYYRVNSGDSSIQSSLEGSHSVDDLPGPSAEIQAMRVSFEKLKVPSHDQVPSHDRFVAGPPYVFKRAPPDTQSLPLLYYLSID